MPPPAASPRRRLRRLGAHVLPALAAAERESVAPRPSRKYVHAVPFDEPLVLPMPEATTDLERAKDDLTEYGMCVVEGAMSADLLQRCRTRLDAQIEAEERVLGGQFGRKFARGKNGVGNLTNKGAVFLELVEHPVVNELVGYVLGRSFLLSSCTGHHYKGPEATPQMLHRDQGFVPASAPFAAVLNMFWMLDDFSVDNGGTHVVPGSVSCFFELAPPFVPNSTTAAPDPNPERDAFAVCAAPLAGRASHQASCPRVDHGAGGQGRLRLRVGRPGLARLRRECQRRPPSHDRHELLPAVAAPAGKLGGINNVGGARGGLAARAGAAGDARVRHARAFQRRSLARSLPEWARGGAEEHRAWEHSHLPAGRHRRGGCQDPPVAASLAWQRNLSVLSAASCRRNGQGLA